MAVPQLQTMQIVLHSTGFAVVELARPGKSNALIDAAWPEFVQAFDWLDQCTDICAVVLKGQGKNFCAGIDLQTLDSIAALMDVPDSARAAAAFRHRILRMQEAFSAIERCRWPVIAAVQGACIGGGVDMIAACDIRYCSADASFSIKEVDLAITADLGSLQRLPPIIGHGAVMELALTARTFNAAEARALGLVSEVLPDATALHEKASQVAAAIAAKSPVAVTGTKRVLLHARDSSVREGLEYVATWNGGQALSHDMKQVFASMKSRQKPSFSKL